VHARREAALRPLVRAGQPHAGRRDAGRRSSWPGGTTQRRRRTAPCVARRGQTLRDELGPVVAQVLPWKRHAARRAPTFWPTGARGSNTDVPATAIVIPASASARRFSGATPPSTSIAT